MVCRHAIGLAGLVSDENYALWVAMYGTRPGVVRAHGAGLHTVLRLAHLGPQGQTTQPSLIRRRQPHRDAADAGCAVERKYAVLSQNDRGRPLQNDRGRLQDDAVAAGDRTFVCANA